jgi:hypothetical protein
MPDELRDYAELNGSASLKLAHLRSAFAECGTSALIAKRWRKNCTRLYLALSDLPDESAEKTRMVVRRHVRESAECRETTQRFVRPEEVLSAFARTRAPRPPRREVRKQLMNGSPSGTSKRRRRSIFGIL